MALSQSQLDRLVTLVRLKYPDWTSFADPRFEKDEVLYKRKASQKAKELLDVETLRALQRGGAHEDILKRFSRAASGNNLLFKSVPEQGDLAILNHPQLDSASFCDAVIDLLHGEGASVERLERYLDYIGQHQLPNKWPFPTYYLFLLHPDSELFVKPGWMRKFLERLGMPDMMPSTPTAGGYAYLLSVAQGIRDGLQSFGPRDMIDLHSAMWVGANIDEGKGAPAPLPPLSGTPRRYWMLAAGEGARFWDEFKAEGIAAIGWDYLGDLRQYPDQESIAKAIVAARGGDEYPTNDSLACYQFVHEMREGDAILIKRGLSTFLGYGIVASDYTHEPDREGYYNVRRVRWLSAGEWELPEDMQLASKTLTDISRYPKLLEFILPLVTGAGLPAAGAAGTLRPSYTLEECARDTGLSIEILTTWIEAIDRKRQAILYGPPGTGKTWAATHMARHLVEETDGIVELVQFHPSYAYEDFIQGIRPESAPDGTLRYPMRPGRFLEFCERAARAQGRCVLVIDEINRGNLSRIFGELMYLLEYRDEAIPLAGGGRFKIPSNVRLLGTMNTADRSIALVDHALRRRFAFLPLHPDLELLARYHGGEGDLAGGLISLLKALNDQIADPHYSLGVSYFLTPDLPGSLPSIWRMEIEPYLEEQFFDRPQKVDQYRWDRVRERLGL